MVFLEHIPVLTKEVIKYLNINSQGIYVDATLGGGGHSLAILDKIDKDKGFLYSFDCDLFAIKKCQKKFKNRKNIFLHHSNFSFLQEELAKKNIFSVDGIIFDLGLSSFQIDDPSRGFSYLQDSFLDMRMDQQQKITAYSIVNTYNFFELKKIFLFFGEELKASLIANEIIKKRPLIKSSELVRITDKFYPSYIKNKKGHSAKRVFQALRIEVNQELKFLEEALKKSLGLLKKNGRLVVISFNSLEDRLVKTFFKKNSQLNFLSKFPIKEKELPITPLTILTKDVIIPNEEEIKFNPRSHSAKLRAVIKNF